LRWPEGLTGVTGETSRLDKFENAYPAVMRLVVLITAKVTLAICVISAHLVFASQANFT